MRELGIIRRAIRGTVLQGWSHDALIRGVLLLFVRKNAV